MSSDSPIQFERSGAVATLWLNRPQVRNAINTRLLEELGRALERVETDEAIRTLVVRGRGAGFCAGADLSEIGAGDALQAAVREDRWVSVFQRLGRLPVPVVAAAHGFALGGGFLLSLYCDWRLVAEGTKLGFPPVARKLVPDWGLRRVALWVGPARTQQLVLTAGILDAEQALRWGLVDQIVRLEELDGAVVRTAEQLSQSERADVAAIRRRFTSDQ